jgi:hypothetical protein
LSFIQTHADLFDAAASVIAEQPAMINEAGAVSFAGQRPLRFALDAGASFMGFVEDGEATAIQSTFGIAPADAELLGTVLALGGLAAAYDGLTGANTLQHIQNTLTPHKLSSLVNAISSSPFGPAA